MRVLLNVLIICFVALQSIITNSQTVTASIESDSILIAKELNYTIEVKSEKEENIIFPDSTSFIPFELISETQVDTIIEEEEFSFSKKYGIISFDEGDFIIPKIKIKIGDKLYLTDSKKVTVNLAEVDTTKQGLYDIKPSFDKFSSLEILKLRLQHNYPIIIFTIVLIFAALYFRDKIFRFFNPLLNIKPALSPIELIQKRISDLEKINIDSNVDIKLFYSQLTYALRSFFEKEIYDKALESTTTELISKLNNLREIKFFLITKNSIIRIEEIFKRADLVKFAKFFPEKSVIHNDLKIMKEQVKILSNLLPEPSEAEKLRNLKYQKEAEKKLRNKRIKIVSISITSLFIIIFILSGLINGFQYTLDKIIFNENLRLLSKTWVKSEYGSPGLFVETPDALVRVKEDNQFLFEEFPLESQFYFSNSSRSIEFYVSNYASESKIDPQNFQSILESKLDNLESMGLQNMFVKYDKFETPNKANGIIISGSADFNKNKRTGAYNIIGFLTETGFKSVVLLVHEGRYLDQIEDRIINSIEALKKKKE